MELTKTNGKDSFNPTPNLTSSPLPIFFIPFNRDDKNCFYCGKPYNNTLFCDQNGFCVKFDVCSNCYIISFGWLESNLVDQHIPILYLPWWDSGNICVVCHSNLEFTSDCQKYCTYCYVFYVGCRYCLITNII